MNILASIIKRISPVQPVPFDWERRQAKLDAKLAERRAKWESHGRAAAEEKLRRSVALTLAEAAADKKLLDTEALIAPVNNFSDANLWDRSGKVTPPARVPGVPPLSF
ncbi:MAG: hypothetical protein WCC90_11390, partial [Methylocella sp.]